MRRETFARLCKARGICPPNHLISWILVLRATARMELARCSLSGNDPINGRDPNGTCEEGDTEISSTSEDDGSLVVECKDSHGNTYTERYVPITLSTTYAADNLDAIQNLLNVENVLSVLAGAYNPPLTTCLALNCGLYGGGGTLLSPVDAQAIIVNQLDEALSEAGVDPQTAQCVVSNLTSGRSWVAALLGGIAAKGLETSEVFDPWVFGAGLVVSKFVSDQVLCAH